jgi:hypothetical protein
LASIDELIIGCSKCPASLVQGAWTPIGFFGEIDTANAWSVSINPSAREFADGRGQDLAGDSQRFARIADCGCCRTRAQVAGRHSARVLQMQRSIFRRVPYRAYFARLGRFIQVVHGQNQPDRDPLLPFTDGVVGPRGKRFVYAHVDIVKCATRSPWSELSRTEKALLVASCLPHLEGQIESHTSVELMLVNGRTAYVELGALLQHLGASLHARPVPLDGRTATLAVGSLPVSATLSPRPSPPPWGPKVPIEGPRAWHIGKRQLHADVRPSSLNHVP